MAKLKTVQQAQSVVINKKATIRDVAREAGVSIGTVSRVLSGKAVVSDALKASVLSVVESLSYYPNRAARNLRGQSTGFIGFLVPDLTGSVHSLYVSGVEEKARESGYNIVVGTTGNNSFRERGLLSFLGEGRVDAAAFLVGEENQPDLVKIISSLGIPTVVIERSAPESVDTVRVDHRAGTRDALNYLLSLGHRKVALLTSASNILTTKIRIAEMQETAAQAGIAKDGVFISTDCGGNAMSFAVASELMRQEDPPTAIMVIASGLAGLLRALKGRNLRIPEDVSVVCLGETELAGLVEPPITTLVWDHVGIGRSAVELLLNRLQGAGDTPARHIMMPCELILRASCSPPRSIRA